MERCTRYRQEVPYLVEPYWAEGTGLCSQCCAEGVREMDRLDSWPYHPEFNPMPIDRVPITPTMEEYARFAQSKLLAAVKGSRDSQLNDGQGYTGVQAQDANYVGAMGELSVFKALRRAGKECLYAPRFDGRPDAGDITVVMDGHKATIDVKAARKLTASWLLVSLPQWHNTNFHGDIFVAVRGVEHEARIMGHVVGRDAFVPAPSFLRCVPSMGVSYDDLPSFQRLLDRLKDGDAIADFPPDHPAHQ